MIYMLKYIERFEALYERIFIMKNRILSSLILTLALLSSCIDPVTSKALSSNADIYVLTSRETTYNYDSGPVYEKTVFEYNDKGLLAKELYGIDQQYGEVYGYDQKNRLITIRPASGDEWGSAYEIKYKKGRKARMDVYSMTNGVYDDPKPVISVDYKYDSGKRLIRIGDRRIKYNKKGRISKYSYYENNWITMRYDTRGNIIKTITATGIQNQTYNNTYDNGLLIKQEISVNEGVYPSTINLEYTLISADRVCIDLVREQQWALINGDYSGTFTSDYFLAG